MLIFRDSSSQLKRAVLNLIALISITILVVDHKSHGRLTQRTN